MAQLETTQGIPALELSDEDLERELAHVHEKRHDIFVTGTVDQLVNHGIRTRELERAYAQRFPERVKDARDKASLI
jgi:Family of unknown function (DUF6158)